MRCARTSTGALSTLLLALLSGRGHSAESATAPQEQGNWPRVGNDPGGMRYSALNQINKQNVRQLKLAWTYHTGDGGPKTTIECTPLVIDGRMYITTARVKVVALEGATGHEIWSFDPYADTNKRYILASGGVNRGLAYWSDGQAGGRRRILAGLADGHRVCARAAEVAAAWRVRGSTEHPWQRIHTRLPRRRDLERSLL